jgi:hypothetical protein
VPKTELTIWVIFTHGVDEALRADEETEVVTTWDSSDINLLTEGHTDGITVLLSILDERPGVWISILSTSESQITSSSDWAYVLARLGEETHLLRDVNVCVMAKT